MINLTASIVSPNTTLDGNGTAKLSKIKATKVSKICDDIETLKPNRKCKIISLASVIITKYIDTEKQVQVKL